MGVLLRRTATGFSPYWFGRWEEDGKRHETSLCRWKGTPPAPGKKTGDAAFEESRGKAKELFKQIRAEGKSEEERKGLVRKVLAARYGEKVGRVKLADLEERWDAFPREEEPTEERRERVHSVLKRFRDFMADRFPGVTEAGALKPEHFKAFFASVDASGVSNRSWNDHLTILRGVLARVGGNSKGFQEYLLALKRRKEKTVHRNPFDGDELAAIFAAALEIDPELHPVIVAAACTALRRGDVCRLRWDSVDLAHNRVTVKASKTDEDVVIDIFPPFRAVLEEAAAKRKKGVPYVWPKIALAYAANPDGLNVRLRRVLAAVGYATPDRADSSNGKYDAAEDAESAAAMVEDGMEKAGWTAKRKAKARRILALHFEGKNGKEIAEEIGTSKGGVSDYFKAMEAVGQVAIVSKPKQDSAKPTLKEIDETAQRVRRGSLCGWHSFRTTFCTLALANGVPMDILRKITGHKTAEIVLKYYDRRGQEEMHKAFQAMPKAIAGAVEVETQKGRTGKGKAVVDLEALSLPPKAAGVAGLLAGADDKTLAAVRRLLKKGGAK